MLFSNIHWYADKTKINNSQIDRARTRIDNLTDKYDPYGPTDSSKITANKIASFKYFWNTMTIILKE